MLTVSSARILLRSGSASRAERAVREYYTAIDAGAIEAAARVFAPEAVYRRPGYPPLRGLPAILEFYVNQRVIGSGVHTLDHVLRDGRSVAVFGSFSGRSRLGDLLAVRFADLWHMRGATATARETFFDVAAV